MIINKIFMLAKDLFLYPHFFIPFSYSWLILFDYFHILTIHLFIYQFSLFIKLAKIDSSFQNDK
jgi:hypothetical protein